MLKLIALVFLLASCSSLLPEDMNKQVEIRDSFLNNYVTQNPRLKNMERLDVVKCGSKFVEKETEYCVNYRYNGCLSTFYVHEFSNKLGVTYTFYEHSLYIC